MGGGLIKIVRAYNEANPPVFIKDEPVKSRHNNTDGLVQDTMKRNRTLYLILIAVALVALNSVSFAVSVTDACRCDVPQVERDGDCMEHGPSHQMMPEPQAKMDCEGQSICCVSSHGFEPIAFTSVDYKSQPTLVLHTDVLKIDTVIRSVPAPLIVSPARSGEPTLYLLNCSFLI